MVKEKRLVKDFYELKVKQLMDKRIWDLPIIEVDQDIHNVLSILSGRHHIWVVKDMDSKELVGVITEHDVLSILAPRRLPEYIFGMPDVRSIEHGTAKTAGAIMSTKVVTCKPEEKIIDALNKMTRYKLRRIPVLENKKIIGEITLHHLIRKYYDATQYNSIVNNEG
ncbi:MAG: transcriptional regulator [Euryarchaeota archaeon RBG_13_31_8]|nr:MAG: transcriptional regulator [Euryarchaeota archaeon RBG_13_31_8]